jgi:lysophospholipase L1-like esterase
MMKVGDCSSQHWYFLSQFGWGDYNLGAYSNLQGVVNQFGESLAYDSQATHNGFNVNAVLAPEWADPSVCQAGESPLQCEIRIHKPSVAVVMFGTSDLLVMTPYEFDFYLRQIVVELSDAGVIPILSTFPGNQGFPEKTVIYNQVVVRLAQDFGLPLINLWSALETLPNEGLEADGFHLGEPPYNMSAQLVAPYLSMGYPMRNLVTLQTLDAVWRGAMQ